MLSRTESKPGPIVLAAIVLALMSAPALPVYGSTTDGSSPPPEGKAEPTSKKQGDQQPVPGANKKRSGGNAPKPAPAKPKPAKPTPATPNSDKPKAQNDKDTNDQEAGEIEVPDDVSRRLEEVLESQGNRGKNARKGGRAAQADSEPSETEEPDAKKAKKKAGGRTAPPRRTPARAKSPRRGAASAEPDAEPGDEAAASGEAPAGRKPGRSQTGRAASAGARGSASEAESVVAPPSGPTEEINIPPSQDDTPPDQRTYLFSIKNGTYAQLLSAVARQTGMGILGDAPKDGTVSFVSEEEMTFDQMLARIRMLLFKYKPHEPYWLLREQTHLEVIRVTDIYRILKPMQIFKSLELFRAANLPDEELALVIFQPKSGSVADYSILRDFMPDYVRIAPMENRNAITIFALVSDIRKYFELSEIFISSDANGDPRSFDVIPVQYISASEAWTKVQELMGSDAPASPRPRSSPKGRHRGAASATLDVMPAPEVSVVPDDAQGVLIVRAMQDKIEEIKKLLPYFDVDTTESFDPVVMELEYVDANDLIPTLQQILAYSGVLPRDAGATPKPPTSRRKRKGKAGTRATTAAIIGETVRILPHPNGDAIIVMADDAALARIRQLVQIFDKRTAVGPIQIPVQHIDPDEVNSVITQILLVSTEGAAAFHVVPDPGGNGVWFSGSESDLKRVQDLITSIDVPEGAISLRVKRLEKQTPSFVVSILQEFDKSGAVGAAPQPTKTRGSKSNRGRRSNRGVGAASPGKFTADDDHSRIFVLCTDEEWEIYLPLIEQIESEVDPDNPPYHAIPVKFITPEEAAEKLKSVFTAVGQDKRGTGVSGVRFEPGLDAVIVIGATDAEVERMKKLIEVFDVEKEIIRRVFVLEHVAPDVIVGAISALITDDAPVGTSVRRPKPGGMPGADTLIGGPELVVLPMGNKLVVRATPEKMERIASLIEEFDVAERPKSVRVYEDFPPTVAIGDIADSLRALLGVPTVRQPGGKRDGVDAADEIQIITQEEARRLIIVASPDRFGEIEERLDILRYEVNAPILETAFLDVQYADPVELLDLIEPLLSFRVQELVDQGVLNGDVPQASAAGVPTPGAKAARRLRQPSGAPMVYHLDADIRNRRIIISAPQPVIDIARELVAQFDTDVDQDSLTETVHLQNTSADDVVSIIREMMGAAPPDTRKPRAGATGVKSAGLSTPEFSIHPAPGDRAIILIGVPERLDQAKEWIAMLDNLPDDEPVIKIYQLESIGAKQIVDLIMATISHAKAAADGSGKAKARTARKVKNAVEEEDEPWVTTIKRTTPDIYLEADLIKDTILVATSPVNIARIDAIVERLDNEVEVQKLTPEAVPKFVYTLEHSKDALNAMFTLETLLAQLWPYGDPLPRVDAAMWDEALVIEHPDEETFPEIEEMIRKYVDKPSKDEGKPVRKVFLAPAGFTAEKMAELLVTKNPHIRFNLEDISHRRVEHFSTKQVLPPGSKARPCVLPLALGRMTRTLSSFVSGLSDQVEQEEGKKKASPRQTKAKRGDKDRKDVLKDFSRSLLDSKKEPSTPQKHPADKPKTSAKPVQNEGEAQPELDVYYDVETGELIIQGDPSLFSDIEDTFEEIKEEKDQVINPPDIRIYRLKYIDVFTAAAVINEMFNATRQQIQAANIQQRLQQRQRIQQAQQNRQQNQPQGKGGTQQNPQGRPGQQQQQIQSAQLPPENVRVYPQPRDRTLILRADPSQYPALLELIATIDQPQPIESKFRTFQLEKLNAVAVEEMLKGLLGLDQVGGQSRRANPARRNVNRQGGAGIGSLSSVTPGGQLPSTILQSTADGTESLGVDPRDIKIFSNEEANTIVAMAPEAALDEIGRYIEELESQDLPERQWKTYGLNHADADGVVEYLSSYFGEESGSKVRGRRSPQRGSRAPSPGLARHKLDAPTFVAYARLNLISTQGTQEQILEIDQLIEQIDVPGEDTAWQQITLARSDAAAVADTLTQMFGSQQAQRGPRRGGKQPSSGGGSGPKFIGEEGGRIVFYTAAESLREQIITTVREIESQAPTSTPRVIALQHAKASTVKQAIEDAFGASRGGGRQGRGPRGGGSSTVRLSVTAHDPSRQLFVIADDKMFEQVRSLVTTIDTPGSIGFEFKIFPLQYASAKKVHGQMTKLMTDFLRRVGGRGSSEIEAFSVEADEQANALIVLGSPSVFGFIEENIKKIDIPANAASPPGFLMVALKSADAQEVATNINQMWGGRNLPEGETAPQAQANRALNTLIVRGTQKQIKEIKDEFIDPLEENAPPSLTSKTFTLVNAHPEAVAESINKIFEAKAQAFRNIRGRNTSPLEFTVIATADVNTKQVIVQASDANMALIEARVAEMDLLENAAASAVGMKIYPLKFADPNAVVTIINEWARSKSQGARGARNVAASEMVKATAEHATQSVVVMASESNHLIVKELIDGLDDEKNITKQRTQYVLKLQHANSDEVANQLTQVFRHGQRQQRGDPGPTFISDPTTNSVLASLNEREHKGVSELLVKLDVPPAEDTERTMVVYPLKYAEPNSVVNVINQSFRGSGRTQPRPADQVVAAVDWGTQSVIVTASTEKHEEIAALLASLDDEENVSSNRKRHVLRLDHADAVEIAQQMSQVFRQSNRRGDPGPTIIGDRMNNALIAKVNDEELQELKDLLAPLDVPPDLKRGQQVKRVALTNADPAAVQDAISKLFGRGGRSPQEQVSAVADFGSKSVVVSASSSNMKRIEDLISQLDSVEGSDQGVHVVNLEHAEAESVARTLDAIFIRSAPRQGAGQAPPISISALQGSKAVLVKCNASDFEEIGAVIAEIDSEESIGSEVRVVTLLYGDATEMQRALSETLRKPGGGRGSELVGDVRISALPQSNALVINGTKDEVDRLEARIKEMDEAGETAAVPQMIRLKFTKPGQILPQLQEMFAEQRGARRGQITPVMAAHEGGEDGDAIIIRAGATDMKAIQSLITELDTEEFGLQPGTLLIPVSSGINVTDLANKVEQAINEGASAQAPQGGRGRGRVPSIVVMPDTRTSSLIISGSPTLFDEAKALTKLMEEASPGKGYTTVAIQVKKREIDDIRRLIDQLTQGSSGGQGSNRARSGRSSGRSNRSGGNPRSGSRSQPRRR